MSINRRAAKRDANERPIIDALEAVGASVLQVSEKGAMDLVVGFQGATHVLEVKAPGKGLTPDQKDFHEAWRGSRIHVVETPEQALRAIGVMPAWTGEMGSESNGLVPAPRRQR